MISAKKRTARTFLEEEGGTQPAEAQPKTSAPRLGGPTPCDDTEGRASLSSSSYTSSEITPGAAMDRSNPRDEKTVADYDDDASGSSEQDSDLHATPSGQPLNFGVVVPGVYRSSFPKEGDYPFLKSLELKTVVTLVQKDFPETYEPFLKANGIKHYVFDMKGTKKEEIPMKTMKAILRLVLDRQNHPLLIHCNHGKHRTGCVVAVVRKVSGWDLSTILDEYKSYATPKVRECDTKYITDFELSSLSNLFPNGSSLGFRRSQDGEQKRKTI
ncbi:Tyrosine phosphatase [Pleurostoma richardsiae]|uniref:diphosphoinositol-polyphosphate diphosphatase n=1 Tax=Pleurostoma richardsiae TaxID=41990 RepID=A0AA38RIV0_9PEZI|nr:Tyrosine phosphatase [Pleurostoma richardsiae]